MYFRHSGSISNCLSKPKSFQMFYINQRSSIRSVSHMVFEKWRWSGSIFKNVSFGCELVHLCELSFQCEFVQHCRALWHLALILSIRLLRYVFPHKAESGFSPDLIPDLQVYGGFQRALSSHDASFHDSRWLHHVVLQACCSLAACEEALQRTQCFITPLYLSGWCAVWCAELLNCEEPGAQRIKKDDGIRSGRPVLCAGELPKAFEGCTENWCQMRVTSEVGQVHEICIKMYSSLSQTVFEILFLTDWWIDFDSQSGTNCTAPKGDATPTRRWRCGIEQIQPRW